MSKLYEELESQMKKLAHLRSAEALLGWDQEVFMPKQSAPYRADQLASLASMTHEIFVGPKMGKLLRALLKTSDLSSFQRMNVEILWEEYQKAKLLSNDFVKKSAALVSKTYEKWIEAREAKDFSLFSPYLKEIVEMKKEEIRLTKWKGKDYDALLDDNEKGLRMRTLDALFKQLKRQLIPLIHKAHALSKGVFQLKGKFPRQDQMKYSCALLEKIGYELENGRIDESPHPFSTAFHPSDSRITTSIDELNLISIWSTLHEAGHGMYEQGLPEEEFHMPSGWARSLSIHESQSRFWENVIGKSFVFWRNEFPTLRNFFKSELSEMSSEDFWRTSTKVEPSLIRTEADELTYHLHIIIRYEIERAIFEEDYPIEFLPKLWNEKYREYLGIEVPDDSVGILQDVHWSQGMFGYFPTYTLGSLYAAQFYQAMKREIDIVDKIFREDYRAVKEWLREKIHSKGGIYSAEEICVQATGEKLEISHFIDYVTEKYSL